MFRRTLIFLLKRGYHLSLRLANSGTSTLEGLFLQLKTYKYVGSVNLTLSQGR